ncbi:hypothetical protein KIN20_004696 [Parelaphostrongylus tenuis]|uniref:Uncharacterized protein n=1 Tax=Parelaphostrongylus tenuis TaxID=148309 RepID=A0AAD5M252_PARTN|nr:hypothetical protein KIN20_004696 [Parelaphostrongylus tenuis]
MTAAAIVLEHPYGKFNECTKAVDRKNERITVLESYEIGIKTADIVESTDFKPTSV